MVLRAVSEYKRPEKTEFEFYHQDLAGASGKKYDNAYDYWFSMFTYQAIDGGLVLWHDIQECWRAELARRGVYPCPKCGTITVMYYKPFCPNCGEVSEHKGALNLFEVAYKLAHQYKKYGVKDYHQYIEAFRDNCEEFGNDKICETYLPERNKKDSEERKNQIDRLEEINMAHPLERYAFWVSW